MPGLRILLLTLALLTPGLTACSDPSGDRAEIGALAGASPSQDQRPGTQAQRGPTSTPDGSRQLLPDLVVRQPDNLYVQTGDDGIREIRFSTSVANMGEGPLEMIGAYEEDTDQTLATQRILREDGTTVDVEVGRFVFHDGHDHWHFQDFTVFELWTVNEENVPIEVVATTGKLTFCLVDSYPVAEPPPGGVAMASILDCNNGIQGISSGWEDTYQADIPGQELDIAEVPDGVYAIRTIVDPDGRVAEADDGNNETTALVEIRDFEIVVLGEL